MKSTALSKFRLHWRPAAAILLALVSTSNSEALTTKYRAWRLPRGRKDMTFRLMLSRSQSDEWYQPPRSPGFNEDFGG
jgi:hypothetical protein